LKRFLGRGHLLVAFFVFWGSRASREKQIPHPQTARVRDDGFVWMRECGAEEFDGW